MTFKAFRGVLYDVLVDGEKVTSFHSLTQYTFSQRLNVQKEYAERLNIPERHVRIYDGREIVWEAAE